MPTGCRGSGSTNGIQGVWFHRRDAGVWFHKRDTGGLVPHTGYRGSASQTRCRGSGSTNGMQGVWSGKAQHQEGMDDSAKGCTLSPCKAPPRLAVGPPVRLRVSRSPLMLAWQRLCQMGWGLNLPLPKLLRLLCSRASSMPCIPCLQALADLKEATPLPIIPVSALHCAGLERLAHALKAAVHAARSRTS